MHVLVSDTSVIIDLERAGLRELIGNCGYRFVVPDLTYNEELADWEGPAWCQAGLEVIELTPEETATAQRYYARPDGLSLADAFALAVSHHRQWILLAGDGALRNIARSDGVECHGVLWVAQLMVDAGANPVAIADGFSQLITNPRCRLPRPEVEAFIQRLRGGA